MALNRHPPRLRTKPFSMVERLGFLRLHLDDIDSLLAILRKSADDVVLATENATADDAEDLKDCTSKELATVAVRTSNPDITVWLARGKCSVETMEDTELASTLVGEAARFLRQRPMPFGSAWLITLAKSSVLLVLSLIAALAVLVFSPNSPAPTSLFTLLIGLFATLVLGTMNWADARRIGGAWIVPVRRSEARGLSANTRAALAIGTMTAVVGAVVGALLTLWVSK